MNAIQQLQQYLNQHENNGLEVYDHSSELSLVPNGKFFCQDFLDKHYNGSLEQFLTYLNKEKDIHKVQIQKVKKQGNSGLRNGLSQNIKISNGASVQNGDFDRSMGSAQSGQNSSALLGAGNQIGMNAMAKAFFYDELKAENNQLKSEIKSKDAEIKTKEQLINDLKLEQVVHKSSFVKDAFGVLAQNPEILTVLTRGGGGGAMPNPGMQGAKDSHLRLLHVLKEHDVSDEIIQRMITLAQIYMSGTDSKAINTIETIMAQYDQKYS
jgi:hypothetical protein